jgi:hypothetical protein
VAYTNPPTWVNGGPPAINANNLNIISNNQRDHQARITSLEGTPSNGSGSSSSPFVNVKDFGAIGDGQVHPLSESYATLAAAQADYPQAIALSDSKDWAAHMKAFAQVAGGTLITPKGRYIMNRTLEVPGYLHWIGEGAQPFLQNRGTWIEAAVGLQADVIKGAVVDNPGDFWTHGLHMEGMTIRGRRFASTPQTTGSGLRICPGENTIFRNLCFLTCAQGGLHVQKWVAPGYAEYIDVYFNRYGVFFDDCTAPFTIHKISGDENDHLINIENATDDPNLSGGHLTIQINGLKAETGNRTQGTTSHGDAVPAEPNVHNPLIRMVKANEVAIKVINAGVADEGPGSTGGTTPKSMFGMLSGSYSAQIQLENSWVQKYTNLIKDDVKGVTVAAHGWGKDDWPNFRKFNTNYRTWERHYTDFEIADPAKGVIQRSPDGTRWRLGVSNAGATTWTRV